ncbi:gliding motility-associated protein GldE [Cytophagales bacterium LB-30]|uniref:Gliding motility-associated protein GldE n=1 Tax=Shiella aurantiaca TaxID=3058365 RepID=A0ABT8F5Z8_9BACT|nr:gliding motility-associated protein GldE [Shiella aurantiaca]MDN4165669.1 gliding motility-associated protein GldE [Shiella aurantiaca]
MDSSLDDPSPISLSVIDTLAGNPVFFIANGIILLILLGLSALISGSEVAFFSLKKEEIARCKTGNSTSERAIVRLIENPKRLLATVLVLNNLVNVAIVMLSTFITWELLGTKTTQGGIVVILTFVVTFAIVFFGEVVPKVYASKNSLSFVSRTAPAISLAEYFFRPISFLLLSVSNVIEKRVEKRGYNLSVDDLNHALELTATEETTEEEKGILKGIVNFGTLSVTQVMRSRMDVVAFEIEDNFHELMDKVNKNGYSRVPVYRDTIDKIEGVLYMKDLLPYIDQDEHFEWQTLLRPGFFVPESKKIDSLLKDFQAKHVHIAIVVDEYGGTSGLITLEDIIEEIVGEINDEFDDDDIVYNKLDDNTYVFEGKTSLNDFCKVLGVEPEEFDEVRGESESLGGLLLEINAKLPRAGEKIHFKNYVFTVVSVDPRRIKRVRVYIKESATDIHFTD